MDTATFADYDQKQTLCPATFETRVKCDVTSFRQATVFSDTVISAVRYGVLVLGQPVNWPTVFYKFYTRKHTFWHFSSQRIPVALLILLLE